MSKLTSLARVRSYLIKHHPQWEFVYESPRTAYCKNVLTGALVKNIPWLKDLTSDFIGVMCINATIPELQALCEKHMRSLGEHETILRTKLDNREFARGTMEHEVQFMNIGTIATRMVGLNTRIELLTLYIKGNS